MDSELRNRSFEARSIHVEAFEVVADYNPELGSTAVNDPAGGHGVEGIANYGRQAALNRPWPNDVFAADALPQDTVMVAVCRATRQNIAFPTKR